MAPTTQRAIASLLLVALQTRPPSTHAASAARPSNPTHCLLCLPLLCLLLLLLRRAPPAAAIDEKRKLTTTQDQLKLELKLFLQHQSKACTPSLSRASPLEGVRTCLLPKALALCLSAAFERPTTPLPPAPFAAVAVRNRHPPS